MEITFVQAEPMGAFFTTLGFICMAASFACLLYQQVWEKREDGLKEGKLERFARMIPVTTLVVMAFVMSMDFGVRQDGYVQDKMEARIESLEAALDETEVKE